MARIVSSSEKLSLCLIIMAAMTMWPGRLPRTGEVVIQPLVIGPLKLNPWQGFAHLNPSVGLGQTFQRTLHFIEG